jgi:uncharacterized Zn-finger protein
MKFFLKLLLALNFITVQSELFPMNRAHESSNQEQDALENSQTPQKRTLKILFCKHCPEKFLREESRKRHLESIHQVDDDQSLPEVVQDEEDGFACNICQKKFDRKFTLTRHMASHSDERPFKCDQCYKSFKRKQDLTLHLRKHSGKGLFECQYCEMKFIRKDYYHDHQRTHTEELPFECNICQKKFAVKSNLSKHYKRHDDRERIFKCDHEGCTKTFFSQEILNRHMSTHIEEHSYECPFEGCERAYKRASDLNVHIKTHNKDNWFACPHDGCKKTYKNKKGLKYHLEHGHNKE